MTEPATSISLSFSFVAAYAEPFVWCALLAISCYQQFAAQTTTLQPVLELYGSVLLILLALRACFLMPPSQQKEEKANQLLWRTSTKPASDARGVFMSLLLPPFLCLAIARHAALDGQQQWQLYGMLIALLSYSNWEGFQGIKNLGVISLLAAVSLYDMDAHLRNALWMLLIAWLTIYHSMETILPASFHGVFTQGEWMVVTSLASVAQAEYISLANSQPNHATIAMAGITSVLITCPIMEVIKKIPLSKRKLSNNQQEVLTLLFQLPFWIGLPLLGVEGLEFYWLRQPPQSMTPPAIMKDLAIPTWCIPKSLLWLVDFLLEKETPAVATALPILPRFAWLLYWLIVLVVTIPFAPNPSINEQPAKQTAITEKDATTKAAPSNEEQPKTTATETSTTTTTTTTTSNVHSIVLMRKWFHAIAVLLFAPVTIAAPQLLSLSYAIATAILILLESARSSLPLLAQFHARYLDPSKDAANGLVISHMALIVGCALPLWISELVNVPPPILPLLQLWGVLSLGIGDAMGAVVGVCWGQTKWSPHNSRTLEGSAAMWTSLMLSCWFVMGAADMGWQCVATVTLVTLLEAHTFQIDNLVLPLAGAASLLLLNQ